MQERLISPGLSEGVDRKRLKAIVSRFVALNHIRLDRVHSALSWRQQIVLDVLPLVFHLNHPALPGYFAADCAHGLDRYQPSRRALQAAQQVARSFRPAASRPSPELTALFLMGSPGSLGHSVASDLDIWVCHSPGLPPGRLQALEQKAQRVSVWAAGYGLELNLFVLSAEDFRQGRTAARVGDEDCGSAQHHLLLDEFYRTAIHLGGRYPLWWLIPVAEEHRYEELADHLLRNRFVHPDEYVDFGAISSVPVEEFLGAGIWQLYKGIESPWKSLLKLLLIECYARDQGRGLLSAQFKQAVYETNAGADDTDPYVMLYRRLEQWLRADGVKRAERLESVERLDRVEEVEGTPARLDLVQKALYLKCGLPLTRAAGAAGQWQGQILSRLVSEWGWDRATLEDMDNRHQWRVRRVMAIRRRLVSELSHSYRLLSRMARSSNVSAAINADDLNLLGRKLFATFQRKAGKVELVNPGIVPSLAEENLAFWQGGASPPSVTGEWWLFRDLDSHGRAAAQAALRSPGSLAELVTWSHCNGLITHETRLGLRQHPDAGGQLSVAGLRNMAGFISTHLGPVLPASREALLAPARPLVHLLLVNVGIDPRPGLPGRGLKRVSGRQDSSGFSGGQDNLVVTIDQVMRNSWHEVSVQRYATGDVLVQCLKNILALAARDPARLPRVEIWCAGPQVAAITGRIRERVNDALHRFFAGGSGPHPLRYLVRRDKRWLVLRFEQGEPRFTGLASEQALMDYLAAPQATWAPVVPDRYTVENDPAFGAVCEAARPGVVQLFWQVSGHWVRIWISDEAGGLYGWRQRWTGSRRQTLMPLVHFLTSLDRRRRLRQMAGGGHGGTALTGTEIIQQGDDCRLEQIRLAPNAAAPIGTTFQARAVPRPDGSLAFDLFSGDVAFTAQAWGRRQMQAAVDYARQRRGGASPGPVSIADLLLPHDLDSLRWQEDVQTCQYVWHWHQLQQLLGQAARGS